MNTPTTSIPLSEIKTKASTRAAATDPGRFPLNQWYVAGFSSELVDKPIARTFLGQKVVLFRTGAGQVAALEDRCCHRSLPLSCGTVEGTGVRCGYHGMLYAPSGQCIEIPGQERIPSKAKVRAYHVVEKNQIVWIWMPRAEGTEPAKAPRTTPTTTTRAINSAVATTTTRRPGSSSTTTCWT